ncbi:hypothetical protein E2542_SST16693 [Spatholobus suberectus]|nr:hypothetical protein E2542_SST16693 [Spatholobus suberectus]
MAITLASHAIVNIISFHDELGHSDDLKSVLCELKSAMSQQLDSCSELLICVETWSRGQSKWMLLQNLNHGLAFCFGLECPVYSYVFGSRMGNDNLLRAR